MEKIKLVKCAVTDVDGNIYDGVNVNGKLWMVSNLKTTKFNNGEIIGRCNKSKEGKLPYFEYPNSEYLNEFEFNNYGLYYNFAAVNTGKLAPIGWHVPSIKEWEELFFFIAQQYEYNLNINNTDAFGSEIAKSLCSTDGWFKGLHNNDVGSKQQNNNFTGFNILPAGFWECASSGILCLGYYATFWSSSQKNKKENNVAWAVEAGHKRAYINKCCCYTNTGYNVRCVMD